MKRYNVYNKFKELFLARGNMTAMLSEDGAEISYSNLVKNVSKISHSLIALGVKSGENIGILMPNSVEYLQIFFGLINIGATPVMLNNDYTFRELKYTLEHADITCLITGEERQSELIDLIRKSKSEGDLGKLRIVLSSDNVIKTGDLIGTANLAFDEPNDFEGTINDVAMILYTSGTTSNPKAVMISHKAIWESVQAENGVFEYDGTDAVLNALPLSHIMGLCATSLVALYSGAKLIVMSKFKTDKVLSLIEHYNCTVFNGVPTMFRFLINKIDGHHITSLKGALIGGSACHRNLLSQIKSKLQVDHIFTGYAQTESLIISIVRKGNKKDNKLGVVGQPLDGVEVKIEKKDPNDLNGEILIKSNYNMMGYYNDEEKTAKTIDKEGYIHTGDIGHLDPSNNIVIINRVSDMIIRGGENISPTEVEDVISKYPGVNTVTVFGVEDELMGQEVCAYIVPSGEPHIDLEDLKSFLESSLAKFKIPKYIRFTSKLPLTSSGKVKKYELQAQFKEKLK